MTSSPQKRKLVRERKLRQSQSRWLQKALFALSKAEDDHAKLLELRAEGDLLDVSLEGTDYPVTKVTASLKEAVHDWLEIQRTATRKSTLGPVSS